MSPPGSIGTKKRAWLSRSTYTHFSCDADFSFLAPALYGWRQSTWSQSERLGAPSRIHQHCNGNFPNSISCASRIQDLQDVTRRLRHTFGDVIPSSQPEPK